MKMPVHIGNSPAKKTGTTNKSGAILGLVVIVLVVVNVLGIGLLSQRAMNAIEVVKGIKSTQAFWIAEGGLGMAISYLPNTNPFSGTLGNGKYDVTITPVSADRWIIESVGSVNIVTRRIRVVVGPDVITTAMMVSGSLDVKGNADVNGVVVENTTPSFEEVFWGVTKEEMQVNATYKYTDPPNNKMPVEKITWINNDFYVTVNTWVGSGIMIVNGDLTINGGIFNGIIWVIGQLNISGNPAEINGAIFVEGEATAHTTLKGTSMVSFGQLAIDDAFSNLGTFAVSPKPAVLSWQEF
jgi:hypothetical protein